MSSPEERQPAQEDEILELTDIISKGEAPAASGAPGSSADLADDVGAVDKSLENLLSGSSAMSNLDELERSLQAAVPPGAELPDDEAPAASAPPPSADDADIDADLDALLAQPATSLTAEGRTVPPEKTAQAPLSPADDIDALLDDLAGGPDSAPKSTDSQAVDSDLESLLNSLDMPPGPGESAAPAAEAAAEDLDKAVEEILVPKAKPEATPEVTAEAPVAAPEKATEAAEALDPFDAALNAAETAPQAAQPAPAELDPFEAALNAAPAAAAPAPAELDPFDAALNVTETAPAPEASPKTEASPELDPFDAALNAAAPVEEIAAPQAAASDFDALDAALAAAGTAAAAPETEAEPEITPEIAPEVEAGPEATPEAAVEAEPMPEPEAPAAPADPFDAALAGAESAGPETTAKPDSSEIPPAPEVPGTAVVAEIPVNVDTPLDPELLKVAKEVDPKNEVWDVEPAKLPGSDFPENELSPEEFLAVAPPADFEAAPDAAMNAMLDADVTAAIEVRLFRLESRLADFGLSEDGDADAEAVANSPLGAALVEIIAQKAAEHMRADLEKQAAAAAARVIREELAALLDAQDE